MRYKRRKSAITATSNDIEETEKQLDVEASGMGIAARRMRAEHGCPAALKERYLCKWDLRYLCRDILGYRDWDVCHDHLYEWMDDNRDGKRQLYLIPRGHLKSSIVTVGRTIQDLLVNPDMRILIANAIWDNARGFVLQIEDYLTGYSRLPEIFGPFKRSERGGKGWTKDAFTIRQRTRPSKEATVTATGVERTQASQHYDKILLDDVVARENIGTKDQRDKIKNFYNDTLSLLEPDGAITVIGTTWHEDDLYNVLRKNKDYRTYVRTALEPPNFETGQPIFPKKFSLEILEKKREEARISNALGQFYAQYFLDPYPDENTEFKKDWFQYYYEIPKDPMYISVCIDPSLGKASSDYAAISATGVTSKSNIYILQARNFKCHIDLIGNEVVKTLAFLRANNLMASVVGLEGFAFQQALLSPIKAAMDAAGFGRVPIEVLPRTTDETKDSRILSLVPYFQNKHIFMLENMVDLKDEMLRFKKNVKRRKDDILDSLAWQINYWRRKPEDQRREDCPPGSLGAIKKEMKLAYQNKQAGTIRQEFGL